MDYPNAHNLYVNKIMFFICIALHKYSYRLVYSKIQKKYKADIKKLITKEITIKVR